MTDLLDLVPAATEAAVGNSKIAIYGIELTGLAMILNRYPFIVERVNKLWADAERAKATGEPAPEIGNLELFQMLGPAVPSFLAAGCGHVGDAKYEQAASRLDIEMQLDLLMPIMRKTMPDGPGPFVEKVMKKIAAMMPRETPSAPRKRGLRVHSMPSRSRASG